MKNNVIIKKDDYERYKIPIPLTNIFSMKRDNFLWEELEKRHPCFSDDFCYSSRKSLTRRGLFADVIVIEKSKLAEYKNKCSFSRPLGLEGCKQRKIFHDNNKKRNYILTALISIFLLLAGLKSISFANKKETISKESSKKTFYESKDIEMKGYKDFDRNLLGNLFDITRDNKGKIKSLNWNLNYSGEKLTCMLDNIFPEQLETVFPELKIPVVKYTDKKPALDFNFVNKFLLTDSQSVNENISFDAKKAIRTFLKENEINILEESTSPYGLVFESSVNKNPKDNVLLKLGALFDSLKLSVTEINITPLKQSVQSNKFHFYLTISNREVYMNNILYVIGNNIDLFFGQEHVSNTIKKDKSNYVIEKNSPIEITPINHSQGVKIGKIEHSNGRKTMFYKNNNGKILKREDFDEKQN